MDQPSRVNMNNFNHDKSHIIYKNEKNILKLDFQVLKEHHKLIRPEEKDIDPKFSTEKDYGNMIAKKYYNKLYREYAIIDLSNTGQDKY